MAKKLRNIFVLFVLGFFLVWGVKGLIGFAERNGDVAGTIVKAANSGDETIQGLKDVYADYFLIGTAVSERDFSGSRLELLKQHFNLVTAENAMKPEYAYDRSGENFDFAEEDELVAKIEKEGLALHGHVLVWHQQTNERLFKDENGNYLSEEEAVANLRRHIRTAIEHYGDCVISWDVVNEAIMDNPPNPSDWRASLRLTGWLRTIGPDYVEIAFRTAKEVLKENGWDHIKLYYNDYNEDYQGKAEAIYQMVKELNEKYSEENNGELLIDGIGMQGHYNLNTDPENVRNSLEKFASLGVEIGVTELDVTAGSGGNLSEEDAQRQAQLYAQLFAIYKENAEHISRVTFWGMDDGSSWRSDQNPLLFTANLEPKLAYHAVVDPDSFLTDDETDEGRTRQGEAIYGTPVIDGEMDEIWHKAPELIIDRYQGAWQGANGVARALWDREHLYILVQVNDTELDHSNTDPAEQDSIVVYIDERNDKASEYEDDDAIYQVNIQNETTIIPESAGGGFASSTKVIDGGYIVEMRIPWNKITPRNVQTIGFDVQINDAKGGARQSVAIWNDETGRGQEDPSFFGELTLTGGGGLTGWMRVAFWIVVSVAAVGVVGAGYFIWKRKNR